MYESDYDRLSEKIRMLKCVKCGSKIQIKPYKFTKRTLIKHTKRYNKYKVESIYVPSCQKCFDENADWVKKTDKIYTLFLGFGGCFCCLTFILWIILGVLFILMDFWSILAILAAIGAVGLLFSQLYKFKALRNEANLNNYIDIISSGEVYVRPKDSKKWFSYQSWINSVMKERMYDSDVQEILYQRVNKTIEVESYDYCRKCGAKLKHGAKFCVQCGYKLGSLI